MFVCEPGTTPAPNDDATALQRPRAAPPIVGCADSYLRDTPRLKRFVPVDQARDSEVPPPARFSRSQVSDGLRFVGHVARASGPGTVPYVSGSRPSIVSAENDPGDFSSQKREAAAYPSAQALRGLAPSPTELTGKPSRAFHG